LTNKLSPNLDRLEPRSLYIRIFLLALDIIKLPPERIKTNMKGADVNLLSPQQISELLTVDCSNYWDMWRIVNTLSLQRLNQVLDRLDSHVATKAIFILSTPNRCRLLDLLGEEQKEKWRILLEA
jgi:Mg/Co/Ni transporter MgtE